VLKDYPEQKDAVTLARVRLGGESHAGPGSRTIWSPDSSRFRPNLAGTLSPDGRFFSYSSNGDLYIHDIASEVDRNITNKPKGSQDGTDESAIAPDGKKIAYVAWSEQTQRYSVRLANLTGEPNPRVLYENPDFYNVYLHGWSPDGKSLAVVLHNVDRTTVQIALLSVSDGKVRVLKTVGWRGGIGAMYFSPDGKYLGYDRPQSETHTDSDVYILAVDGSADIPAIVHPASDSMVGWSPDGKWLLFSSDRTTGTTDLWAVAVTDGKTQGTPQRLRADIGKIQPIGWTSSGGLLYQIRHGGGRSSNLQLATLDLNARRYSSALIGRGYQEDTSLPLWSPDGTKLAYKSEFRGRANSELVVIRDSNTGTVQEVKPKGVNVITLDAWTPDRSSLLIEGTGLGGPEDGQRGIYRLNIATGDASLVSMFPQGIFFFSVDVLLPDGLSFLTKIGRSLNGTPRDSTPPGIYRVEPQSGKLSALVLDEPSSAATALALSKDGKSIYIRRAVRPNAGEAAYIERNLATGNERQLIHRSFLGNPHLSPDGQYIATASTDPASNSRIILLVPTAGGEARELMRVPSDVKPEDLNKSREGRALGVAPGAWAPDALSLLVMDRMRSDGNSGEVALWRVSLSGEAPRRITGDGSIPSNAELFVSPDGRHFVYTVTEQGPPATSEVAILENFLPKPTKK
jgi:Tol biopolymer transport system component